jgi:predicted  nucleic acid-binding Zn-ribbon protein
MTLAEAWDLTMRDIEEVKVAISALQAENEKYATAHKQLQATLDALRAENERLKQACDGYLGEMAAMRLNYETENERLVERTGMAEIERLKEEAGENGPELVAALRARIKHLEALTPRNSSPPGAHSKE